MYKKVSLNLSVKIKANKMPLISKIIIFSWHGKSCYLFKVKLTVKLSATPNAVLVCSSKIHGQMDKLL